MKNKIFASAVAVTATLALAACGSAPEDEGTTAATGGETATESIDFKIGIVSDAGGFDDQSFNQLSYEGAKRAADELGAEFAEVQSDSETDFQPNLESLVAEGANSIVAVGSGISSGHSSRPKHDCAAIARGHTPKCLAPGNLSMKK